jgi:hypothetical protein
VKTQIERIVTDLEATYPDFQIWVVYPALGGVIWCARRWDGQGSVINTDSPERLADRIARGR